MLPSPALWRLGALGSSFRWAHSDVPVAFPPCPGPASSSGSLLSTSASAGNVLKPRAGLDRPLSSVMVRCSACYSHPKIRYIRSNCSIRPAFSSTFSRSFVPCLEAVPPEGECTVTSLAPILPCMANATVIIVWCLVTAQNPHLHLRTEKAYKTRLKQALSKACLNPGLTLGAPAP